MGYEPSQVVQDFVHQQYHEVGRGLNPQYLGHRSDGKRILFKKMVQHGTTSYHLAVPNMVEWNIHYKCSSSSPEKFGVFHFKQRCQGLTTINGGLTTNRGFMGFPINYWPKHQPHRVTCRGDCPDGTFEIPQD